MKFGLTETQEKILIGILKKHIKSGETIVFGSRAMGTNTERSDIDIALKSVEFFSPYSLGDLIDEIAESDFPYLADILIYEEITNPALKEHIDRVGMEFITKEI
ncbi:nucleotidyltransferase domain-containing protein [Treponema sp. OMZ 792]|uniref:nucleotidyltransferase family protein n=1 Tax=unclassified Treponema TaxID=2638727 RepID=UPI0020A29B8D|nr:MULTISPECIES: nucleotidyltransferase domain-containing protein [unclassified Treponema]UTC76299.1 nucleotidyltransferase domain-containing protein [Treponema sp. OMZ 792]UTC77813.1 nucleotidyltransferase domain-containing protein [Treponema sp. OMZ 799]UTC80307.1 nucleotidyltransferase domain-containing protein [Treponema sp. OMZ 798]